MCQKYQRRCSALLQLRDEVLEEWTGAETQHAVWVAWGRLGGRVTLHRYGPQHFSELARRRRGSLRYPMEAASPYGSRVTLFESGVPLHVQLAKEAGPLAKR